MSSLLYHSYIIECDQNERLSELVRDLMQQVQLTVEASEIRWIENENATIGIEKVRDLLNDISLTSLHASYRVYVIKQADKLTNQAQNALLKVLEEPPKRVTVILGTQSESLLLPTIGSRCRVIRDLKISKGWEKLPEDSLVDLFRRVEEVAKDKEQLEVILDSLIINVKQHLERKPDNERVMLLVDFLLQAKEWLRQSGVNGRLVVENCVLGYWSTIKSNK